MYHELLEELIEIENQRLTPPTLKLVNKSFIDSFYDLRSEINPIYNYDADESRILESNYPFIILQKILTGLSKAIYLNLNPFLFTHDWFTHSGRFKIPDHDLEFSASAPGIHFKKDSVLNYASSSLFFWEDELMRVAPHFNARYGLTISREGIRAAFYRNLEAFMAFRSTSGHKRVAWTIFLHELIILQKTFTPEELSAFSMIDKRDHYFLQDTNFPERDYLEFQFHKTIGEIHTAKIAAEISFEDRSAEKMYSELNRVILGKIPLCHFFVNEQMFIGKNEHTFENFYKYCVRNWTNSKDVHFVCCHAENFKPEIFSLDQFSKEIKRRTHILTLGFFTKMGNENYYHLVQPHMVKADV